jgi:hypothetical protein
VGYENCQKNYSSSENSMKIIHQISNVWNQAQVAKFRELGVNIQVGHDVFQIEENEKYYSLIGLIRQSGASDWVGTQFDKEDLLKSNQLCIQPQWINDYPQPLNYFLETCYDLSAHCTLCGIGKVQKSPLRLKREPNWGRRNFFSLNWIFDEIFVQKSYYDSVLKSFGIESKEVFLHTKNQIVQSTVQLIIPDSNIELDLSSCEFSKCEICGRKKYFPITKGFFPNFTSHCGIPIVKSQEFFGSGGAADKKIIVNQDLFKVLYRDKGNIEYYPSQ